MKKRLNCLSCLGICGFVEVLVFVEGFIKKLKPLRLYHCKGTLSTVCASISLSEDKRERRY